MAQVSNHLISEVYKRKIGNMARKAVLVLFADKASDDGTGIWASKQRMADELGATKQTVISTIKGLIDDGFVRESGQRKCSNGFTVEYAINVQALLAAPLVESHQSKDLTGQNRRPVKSADLTGQNPRPKPSRTPHKNIEAHELPDDWQPEPFGPDTKSRAAEDGWPPGEREHQLEHFRAHHRKKGSKWKDWQAAWSTWVLNNRNFGGNRNGSANRTSSSAGTDRRSSLARAIDEGLDWLGGPQAGVS